MSAIDLVQIKADLKVGRENALVGSYDTAAVYYEGVCKTMQRQVAKATGANKARWQEVS